MHSSSLSTYSSVLYFSLSTLQFSTASIDLLNFLLYPQSTVLLVVSLVCLKAEEDPKGPSFCR